MRHADEDGEQVFWDYLNKIGSYPIIIMSFITGLPTSKERL